MENNILLLQEILDHFEAGTLDMSVKARKCYLSEKEKHFNRVSWIHNDELKAQCTLRGMSKKNAKDFLKQTKEKL